MGLIPIFAENLGHRVIKEYILRKCVMYLSPLFTEGCSTTVVLMGYNIHILYSWVWMKEGSIMEFTLKQTVPLLRLKPCQGNFSSYPSFVKSH